MTGTLSRKGTARLLQAMLPSLRVTSLVLCFLLFLGNSPTPAQTTSAWSGGVGNWEPCPSQGGTALWDTCSQNPPVYPDGNANAVINGGPVTLGTEEGASIDNLSLASGDSLIITPGYLDITGTSIVNNGSITVGSGNGLFIQAPATVTLSGSGTVTIAASNARFWGGNGTGATLINQQTIQGQGALGVEGLAITNQGIINANAGTLSVQPASAINTGTMEASSGSTLAFTNGAQVAYNNAGGVIKALGGGTVQLEGGVYTGGTLTTTGSGVIQLSGDATLINVTSSGTLQVPNNTALLETTMTNTGTIQVASGTVYMAGNVTLTGSGSLIISGSGLLEQNLTSVGPPGGSLTNQQLIHGAGTIYDLPLTNQATIEADNTSAPLYLENSTTTNTGTLEASGGGTLEILNNETVNNTGGTVEALAGSTVILIGTLNGGTLATSGSGVIESENGTLDGTVNVPTITGTFDVPSPYSLTLEGTINNKGTIAMTGNGCIALAQPTTLTGSGKVTMSENNCIYGSGLPFTNQSTIEGTGSIGDSNPMPITNNGKILANKKTPLTIVPNSGGFTNNGTLTVNKGSTLTINSIGGPFNNLSGGTLTGGTYDVSGMLEIGNAITANAAAITLTGAAGEIYNSSSGTNALAGLAGNASKGVLSLQSGQILTTATSLSNAGKITVGAGSGLTIGGSYAQTAGTSTVDGALTASSGMSLQKGTLLGKGTVAAAIVSSGTITVGDSTSKPGVLTVAGSYTQNAGGALNVAIGGTTAGSQYSQMPVSNGVSLGGTLTIKLCEWVYSSSGRHLQDPDRQRRDRTVRDGKGRKHQ